MKITEPVRIQLSRKKGFNLQEYSRSINGLPAVVVSRPSRWGNIFKIGETFIQEDGESIILNRQQTINLFEQSIFFYGNPVCLKDIINALRGKNLACWCGLSEKCHGDILLKIAND